MSPKQCYEWFKRLKRAECWLVKIPGLDNLPHQQTTITLREFVL